MNQTIGIIKSRRSIRSFYDRQIKQEELNSIIEAGMYAPSLQNQQPWHFTVIQNKQMIDMLNKELMDLAKGGCSESLKGYLKNTENFHVFYNAPTIIIVSGDEKIAVSQIDCAAATENMLIAAESLGIGSCWIGFIALLFNSDRIEAYKEQLCIPKGFKPYHAIALGYRNESIVEVPVRKENIISYIK